MAVNSQVNWQGQQRVDLPHLKMVESGTAYDFDALAGIAIAGRLPLVVTGFEAVATGAVGNDAEALTVLVAGATAIAYEAAESGSIFHVPDDRAPEILAPTNPRVGGSFTPGTTNYVGVDFVREPDATTADQVAFLNPTTEQDAFETVPLRRTIDYRFVVTTVEFSAQPGVVPVAVVVTDASNKVTRVDDARLLFGALAPGFAWPGGRFAGPGRGDRALASLKQWVDAVMVRTQELGGGPSWFSPTADRNVRAVVQGSPFVSNGEYMEWDGTNLHWTGQTFVFDNTAGYVNEVANQTMDEAGLTDLADGDCVYVDLDRTANRTGGLALVAQKATLTTLGIGATPGSRWVLAWRVGTRVFSRNQEVGVGAAPVPVVADWDDCRYFFVDNDDGNDASIGYIDDAPNTTFLVGAVDLVKIKTVARLMQIVPKVGAGRQAVILFKNRALGAVYQEADLSPSRVDLSGIGGYGQLIKRGSTDLTNSPLDRKLCGAVNLVAGPNGDGSYTASAGSTSTATIAVGTFAAEPGVSGARVRFKGNVTVDLENEVIPIIANTSTVLTFGVTLSDAVDVADEFFIERPGACFASWRDVGEQPVLTTAALPGVELLGATVGIGVEAAAGDPDNMSLGAIGHLAYAFCENRNADGSVTAPSAAGTITCGRSYRDEGGALRDVGTGVRAGAPFSVRADRLLIEAAGWHGVQDAGDDGQAFLDGGQVVVGGACYFDGGVELRCGNLGRNTFGNLGAAGVAKARLIEATGSRGALMLLRGDSDRLELNGVTGKRMFTGAGVKVGSNPDSVFEPSGVKLFVTNFDDDTGINNNGPVVDVSESDNNEVAVFASDLGDGGAVGGVALQGASLGAPVYITYAQLEATDVKDASGNHVQGAGGLCVGDCFLANDGLTGVEAHRVVRSDGDTGGIPTVVKSQANGVLNARNCGVTVTTPNADGYTYICTSGRPVIGIFTSGDYGEVAYLYWDNAGIVTETIPPLSAGVHKLRCGQFVKDKAAGALWEVAWHPEQVGVVADGNP